MAANAEKQWHAAKQIHRELRAKLKEKESLIGDIEDLISELRVTCDNAIFADFAYATAEGVETALWEAHSSINKRYRKIVARLKSPEQRRITVERRKWEKRYADFLKLSQYYYKGYIQRLASHFEGLDELRIIAHRLTLSTQSIDPPVKASEDLKHLIFLSCHSTLLRLGDLYRYRNDLNTKDRSWEKANAHYGLANDLYPDSGSAFNQMAVISLADGNHLDAVYYLYRALAVKEPHPLAQSNLAVEFKKITTTWLGPGHKKDSPSGNPAAGMVLWFVRLHAQLYKGEEFHNHDELENEALSQMTVLLKEQSLEDILDRIVIINIAAEYFAGVRLAEAEGDEESERCVQAYYFYLRLNVRMLFMLLQLLQPELDDANHGHNAPDVTGKEKQSTADSITAVTRRILPALRQYSTWLVATAPVISAQVGTAPICIHIKEMWSMYCTTLSLLVSVFPVAELPDIDYLLEEDSATVGFKPFRDSTLCRLYTDSEDKLKKRSTDPGVERHHPNVEMMARIREILRDGMVLATNDDYPIYAVDGQFRFFEDGPPPAALQEASPLSQPSDIETQESSRFNYGGGHQRVSELNSEFKRPPSVDPSESHQSLSTDMYQMVDDLLTPSKMNTEGNVNGSGETSYGMHSNTAMEVFASLQGMNQESYQPTPPRISGFPGFAPSPFSPRPGELQGSGEERRPSTRGIGMENHAPMVSFQSSNNSTPHSNWNRTPTTANTSFQRGGPSFNAAQQLQQSLEAQYQPSDFSNSSSIYQNTPIDRLGANGNRAPFNPPHKLGPGYAPRSEYEKQVMLQSSAWNGSQPAAYGRNDPTPPSGQGS
ncbi:hypothetical protein O988_07527 [Pseudogymnoascus sp. VKM F-3808]|nr:hypothetical protein O988_07527 [Pseudogymnoascus sp. VKM F-3808]